jgi:hypothetical protein
VKRKEQRSEVREENRGEVNRTEKKRSWARETEQNRK